MFATAVPGLAPIAGPALGELAGITVRDTGFDTRSDVILFDATSSGAKVVGRLRLIEDEFVEVGRTLRADGDRPTWIAGRIWRPARVERALAVWSQAQPVKSPGTFRVIVRVLQESSFKRTELRDRLTELIGRDRSWRPEDPAQLEVWLIEYAPGRFVAGLRLSDSTMRQHGGRERERRGALRPTVANAMIRLAGKPGGPLLDPCCGSGTILNEALECGWGVVGRDIDSEAVQIARRNVPDADIRQGDVRDIDLADQSVRACVANLPFGRQYTVPGEGIDWLRTALTEIARVTELGGRVVLLTPGVSSNSAPTTLSLRERHPISLLGTHPTIWVFDRVAS